jgi:hypothetical protein
MAILAPADLPSVLKLRSEPMKKYVLSQLGYSNVEVEISEDQWETVWRVAGDFIAGYFPREQKLGLFWTSPLQSTYPLPEDAYWIQEVNWDPVTTRIDDVFGAESFLFCVSNEFKILDRFGSLQPVGDWKKNWKAKTPFGDSGLSIKKHENNKSLPKVRICYDGGVVEATYNHVLQSNGKWREFGEVKVGDKLSGLKDVRLTQHIEVFESVDAIGLRANKSGCYYGCSDGEPVLIH